MIYMLKLCKMLNFSSFPAGGIPSIKVSSESVDCEGTLDTGIGSGSGSFLHDTKMGSEQRHISGTAHTYSDGTESTGSNMSDGRLPQNKHDLMG